MKVLHVISSADPQTGGPVEGIRQLSRPLVARGHIIHVASADDPAAPFVADFPLTLYALGPGRSNFRYAPRLRQWLEEHVGEYDAVIVNGLWQYPSLAVRRVALRAKKPYWVYSHGMLDPWFNRTYPLKRIKKNLFWPWQHAVLRDARAVLFTCDEERLLARQSFRPYRIRERVVSYGTSGPEGEPATQTGAFVAAFPQLRDRRFLLFLGRIHPKKGCDILLKAFAAIAESDPDMMLVIAGPGEGAFRSALEEIVARYGLRDRVVWPGMLQGDLKWGAFYCAEAFVLPSHQENFGIAVAEALACGLPVLITRPVNIWREVQDDGAGIVGEDTAEGFEAVLRQWISLSPSDRAAMSERAVSCFRSRFEIERAAQSLLDAIQAG